jgi:hypothetical protein
MNCVPRVIKVVIKEMPIDPPTFRRRLVIPVASPIFSLGMDATEKVDIGTKIWAMAKPLMITGTIMTPGLMLRLNSPKQHIEVRWQVSLFTALV